MTSSYIFIVLCAPSVLTTDSLPTRRDLFSTSFHAGPCVETTLGIPENYTESCSISRSNSRIMGIRPLFVFPARARARTARDVIRDQWCSRHTSCDLDVFRAKTGRFLPRRSMNECERMRRNAPASRSGTTDRGATGHRRFAASDLEIDYRRLRKRLACEKSCGVRARARDSPNKRDLYAHRASKANCPARSNNGKRDNRKRAVE